MNKGLIPLLLLPALLSAAVMHVQTEKGQIRDRPSFLGRIIATVPYGTAVNTARQQGAWTQIPLQGGSHGWISTSALTKSRIQSRATSNAVGTDASTREISLAGKGFNASVEKQVKSKNPKLRFADVDAIEKSNPTPQALQRFIQQGQLNQP